MLALLIGVAKSGTTWFWAIARKHPDSVAGPDRRKEPRFWTTKFKRGLAYYRNICPYLMPGKFALDASPDMFIHPDTVIDRIRGSGIEPTIVVVLREPVERAFSHWRFHRCPRLRPPGTTLPFGKYVGADLRRISRVGISTKYYEHNCAEEKCKPHIAAVGAYSVFLEPWIRAFGDKVAVYFFEDFTTRPKEVMGDFFARLGLPSTVEQSWIDRSDHFTSRFKSPRKPGVEKKLQNLYRPYNRQLSELLGRELPKAWQY